MTDTELTPGLTIINVRYLGQRDERVYAYLVPPFINIEKGDIVVVQARDTVSLAKVINFNGSPEYATKYVVQKVDFDQFNDWMEKVVPF